MSCPKEENKYGYEIPNQYPYPLPEKNYEGEPIEVVYISRQYQTPPTTGGILLQDIKDYVPAMVTNEFILPRKMVEKFSNKLKEINDMPEKEKVLVFPKEILIQTGWNFLGVSREGTPCQIQSHPLLCSPSFQSSLRYMDREEAETNENFLQLIPYCVFKCGKNFLVYQRTKKGGEARLHDKWSLGVGGHINPCDGDAENSYEAGMMREIQEEVDFWAPTVKNHVLGLIYDNSNAVGRVHFGVIHLIEVPEDSLLNFKDPALDKGSWVGYDWLLDNVEKFENWSQLTIEHLG